MMDAAVGSFAVYFRVPERMYLPSPAIEGCRVVNVGGGVLMWFVDIVDGEVLFEGV